eukprot:353972-Chlamydomonas_euryale.AAC.4
MCAYAGVTPDGSGCGLQTMHPSPGAAGVIRRAVARQRFDSSSPAVHADIFSVQKPAVIILPVSCAVNLLCLSSARKTLL